MARYENALRKISLLFLIMNLLMPLGTDHAFAENTTPTDPPTIQETSSEEDTQNPPPVADTDEDGIADTDDSCPSVTNTGIDTDGDGADDACDPTPNGDKDGNGMDDAADNCPSLATDDQTDSDGDGIGDACDDTPFPAVDTDGDGVPDGADICANGNDTVDTDGDSTPDACDSTPNGDIPVPVVIAPADPWEDLAVCTAGILTPPSLTMPDTVGIVYTTNPVATDAPYSPGQTVTITATLSDDTAIWDPAFTSDLWSLNTDTNTYSRAFTFTDVPCKNTTAGPTLNKNVTAKPSSDAGLMSLSDDPIVIGDNDKIPVCHQLGSGEYNRPNPDVGQFVTGNGHASHPGDIWPNFIYNGVTYLGRGTVPSGADDPNCVPYTQVVPGTPTLGSLTCGDNPRVNLPTTPGITYSVSGPVNNTYTITATTDANAFMLANNLNGWKSTYTDPFGTVNEATYTLSYTPLNCPTTLPTITVTEVGCNGGLDGIDTVAISASTGLAATITDDQGHILTVTPTTAGTYTDTLALLNTFNWPADMTGWTFDADTNTYAQQFTLVAHPCDDVVFPDISINQATCTTGTFTGAAFSVDADDVEGLTIAVTVNGNTWDGTTVTPGTPYTITAELDDDYAFPAPLPEGWNPVEGSTTLIARTVTIQEIPCITISKSVDKSSVNPGGTITYTITVTNTGTDDATDVLVTDTLPHANEIDWMYGGSLIVDGQFSETISTLSKLTGVKTYAITGTVPADGTVCGVNALENTAYANAMPSDTVHTDITCTPAIEASKTAVTNLRADGVLTANDTITYTITAQNTGNVDLTSVALNDVLTVDDVAFPVGVSWTDPVAFDGTIASLPAGGEPVIITGTYTITQADIDANVTIENCITVARDTNHNDDCVATPLTGNPAITLSKEAITVTKSGGDIVNYDPGDAVTGLQEDDTVTYQFVAKNTGTVTLDNVTVSELSSFALGMTLDCTPAEGASLVPQATMTCTGTYTVQQSDINAQAAILNKAEVSGTPRKGEAVTAQADETVYPEIDGPAIGLSKTATLVDGNPVSIIGGTYPVTGLLKDQVITYSFTITNTGNVTLTSVQLEELSPNALGMAFTCDPTLGSDLNPKASITCTGDYIVTQADVDAGSIFNEARATGTYQEENVTATDDETVQTKSTASIGLTKDVTLVLKAGQTTPVAYGPDDEITGLEKDDQVTYSLTVINTGDVTLHDVTVTDPKFPGLSCTVDTLASSDTHTCTVTYTITRADVDAQLPIPNTATATGVDPQDNPVGPAQDTETIHVVSANINLVLDKLVNGQASVELSSPRTVTYTYTISNQSNVTLTNVHISSDSLIIPAGIDCDPDTAGVQTTIATLLAHDSATCTVTYSVTQHQLNTGTAILNTAQATGTTTQETTVLSNEDTATVTFRQTPKLTLTKKVSDLDESLRDAVTVDKPQTATYTFTVRNDGNVTLDTIAIIDPMFTGDAAATCLLTTLDPAESTTCTATYAVSAADIGAGTAIINVATATGQDPKDTPVTSNDDSATINITQIRNVTASKTAVTNLGTDNTLTANDTITYTITVTNTGNVDLTDVALNDVLTGPISNDAAIVWDADTFDDTIATLVVGQTFTITGTYTITQADIDTGVTIKNCITVAYDTTTGDNCATTTLKGLPGLLIEKTASPTGGVGVGDTITYTFVVTNTGDVTITDIVVNDAMLAKAGIEIPPVGDLAPGASTTITATYVVTKADVAAGKVVNLATADGELPNCEQDCDVDSPPDTVTVPMKPVAPTPATPEPAKTPESRTPVTGLPVTGSGNESGPDSNLTIWMLAITGSVLLAGVAFEIRRRYDA